MAAVTQRIDNYLGGVSKQADDKKLPGQVRECFNGYPDPTFGLLKRPGFKWIANLGTGTTLDSSKWFYIARTSDERYIGCIRPAGITVTGNGGSGATDKVDLATTGGNGSDLKVDLTASGGVVTAITINTSGHNYNNNDTITIASGTAGTANNVTGTYDLGSIDIWNADTGEACTVNYVSTARAYLSAYRDDFTVLTVQDTSIITNNRVIARELTAPSYTLKARATLVLSGNVTSGEKYNLKVKIGSNTTTISEVTAQDDDTYKDVLEDLDSNISSGLSNTFTITRFKNTLLLEKTDGGAFELLDVTGGPDHSKLRFFQDEVSTVGQLPVQSKQDRKVKIINTDSDKDTYWAKFVATNGTSGEGYWQECADPQVSTGLNKDTMPHELINTALNTFSFQKITYNSRIVGDTVTNSSPSFVGSKIQQAFFHSNRLGFLSDDNVSLSQAGDYYNFYHISALVVTDSDPIDLSTSTIRPASLHGVIPTAQGLILFSKNQQFLMSSTDGILTPTRTSIRAIANYEMDTDVDPVDSGTTINFISKTPSYTRIFGMVTRGQDENPEVLDIGRVVNEWIPSTVDTFIASPQNQFIAMSSQSSKKIYFYRTYHDGQSLLVQAWFNWVSPGTVQTIAVDSDDFFVVTKQDAVAGSGSDAFVLSKASLSQSPDDAIIVSNQGQRVNPCMDLYTEASNGLTGNDLKTVVYDTAGDFSKCYIPWVNTNDLTPVIIIKGSTATGQFIESGFTITPTIGSDGSGTYFKVPKKDITSMASDVIVGWKYDFDVTLPKTYFKIDQAGRKSDFTATLTVARMKFSCGLSGVMGFKLKSTGVFQGSKKYTGDGSTTIYGWSVDDFTYVDKSQIKLKINGIVSTAFTVSGDTQITLTNAADESKTLSGNGSATSFDLTFIPKNLDIIKVKVGGVLKTAGTDYHIVENFINFTSAPASGTNNISIFSADELEVFLDEWYDLNPIAKVNTYLANDVTLNEQQMFTLPIHQKSDNFQLRLFNDSPFPVSLNSMMWEGNYSPRFYRRI